MDALMARYPRSLVQLIGTLLILAMIPTNIGKLLAFLIWWAITFRHITKAEAIFILIACLFFSVMNTLSLKQGIFSFRHPDLLGMPVYELFMWGFYLLHTRRTLNGPTPRSGDYRAWILAILYAIAFATIANQTVLLVATSLLLLGGLVFFHKPHDLAYTGYMIMLGAAIEYTGVLSGQWYYPNDPPGGVPLWFITLWGGVGLFLRRLVLPVLVKFESKATT